MKYKYFLRGLGTGIILSALILCISYRSSGSDKNVVEQAKELGMIFPEGTQSPEQSDEIAPTDTPVPAQNGSGAGVTGQEAVPGGADQTDAPDPTTIPAQTDPPKDTTSPKKTAKPKKTDKPKKAAKPAETKKPDSAKGSGVSFKVRGGLLSSTVAREMKEAGILQNDKKFDQYLVDSGYATKIREGTYKIPVGASYEEIAKIITRSK